MNMKVQYHYPDAQMLEELPPTYEETFPMFPDKDYNRGSQQQHTHSTTSTTTGIQNNMGAQQPMRNSSMRVFLYFSYHNKIKHCID